MSIKNYLVGFAVLGMVFAFGSPAAAASPQAVKVASVVPDDASGGMYSEKGAATCLACHNSAPVNEVLKTPHAMTGDAHSPFGQHGCESCHGPSDAHATGFTKGKPTAPAIIFNGPNASPVAVRNKACLSCHQDATRMNWVGSAHQHADLACTSCHTIHAAKDPILVRDTQVEKCFTCHTQQRAESFQYSHHPIREGKTVCSDCHNPHGSMGPGLLKEATVNQTCYDCHADKRGPMLWEHQPVRDNCLNCHTPHGSPEPRLMKERMAFMCSSCHSATSDHSGGAFGGAGSITPSQKALINSAIANNRTCLNCHSQVHGSNSANGAYLFR